MSEKLQECSQQLKQKATQQDGRVFACEKIFGCVQSRISQSGCGAVPNKGAGVGCASFDTASLLWVTSAHTSICCNQTHCKKQKHTNIETNTLRQIAYPYRLRQHFPLRRLQLPCCGLRAPACAAFRHNRSLSAQKSINCRQICTQTYVHRRQRERLGRRYEEDPRGNRYQIPERLLFCALEPAAAIAAA